MADDELEALRKRRLQELQARMAQRDVEEAVQRQADQETAAEAEVQKEQLLRQILTMEARGRLARLKLARPEDARVLEAQLIQLAQSGRLTAQIDDEQLKVILARLFSGSRDIKIRRK